MPTEGKGGSLLDWISGFIASGGYGAVAALTFAENLFPPIPSELILPLAGFTAARGDLSLVGVVVAGSIGSLAGALLYYGLGVWVGAGRLRRWSHRYGRWLTVEPREFDRALGWFRRWGGWAVGLGRLVPAVRTLISIPAGLSGMPLPRFLLASALGTGAWTTALSLVGFLLEDRYEAVAAWTDPVSKGVVAALVVWYLYRVVTFRRRNPKGA